MVVGVACVVAGAFAASFYGGQLRVLAVDRTGDPLTWRWLNVAHPAGVSASWSVVYGAAYIVVALVLIADPWDWRGEAWADALCATALVLGVALTLVVPVVVPLRAFAAVLRGELARAKSVRAFDATPEDFSGHELSSGITPDLSYGVDLVQREVAYRRWVAYNPRKGVTVPTLTVVGCKVRRQVRPDRRGTPVS